MDHRKLFLVSMVAVLSAAFFLMMEPFLTFILFAVILAFLLHPLKGRMSSRLGNRVSAIILMVFAFLVAVIPIVLGTGAILGDVQDLSKDVNRTDFVNTSEIEFYFSKYTGLNINLDASLNNALNEFSNLAFGSFTQVLNLAVNISIGLTMMVFLLYYFLKDGSEMVQWFKEMLPIPEEVKDNVFERVNRTTWAVIRGHLLIAVIQGLIAGLGLFLTGVPNYLFWTFVMIVLGIVPVIGSVIVWGPASFYLFTENKTPEAAFLVLYGLIVVGLTDNFLRPILVDRKADIHPAAILIGVIGGVHLFGAAGIFFGPILVGVLKSLIVVLKDNYN